jgi:hypothetical protein
MLKRAINWVIVGIVFTGLLTLSDALILGGTSVQNLFRSWFDAAKQVFVSLILLLAYLLMMQNRNRPQNRSRLPRRQRTDSTPDLSLSISPRVRWTFFFIAWAISAVIGVTSIIDLITLRPLSALSVIGLLAFLALTLLLLTYIAVQLTAPRHVIEIVEPHVYPEAEPIDPHADYEVGADGELIKRER